MAEPKDRVVFLKLSGEVLADGTTGWSAASLANTVQKLARAYQMGKQIGVKGIALVPGAGNIIRGRKLKKQKIVPARADMLGRLGTIMNSLVVAESFKEAGIPAATFIAKGMIFRNDDFTIEEYSAAKLKAAFVKGQIGIIAGGSGKDNVTTDYGVALWAGDFKNHFPDTEVVVLKGTKWDGVFDDDPATVANVRRYKIIGAPMMQRDYERFSAVDERSLQEIIDSKLEMLVYADDKHSIESVLRHDLRANSSDNAIGTLIVPDDIEPVFY